MAEGLQIDSDWKRQAQEEKRKLVEAEAAKQAVPAGSAGAGLQGVGGGTTGATAGRAAGRGGARAMPEANFSTLVQSLLTQTLYYLGELAPGGEGTMNLDMAKHHVDTLSMLEEKTRGNLTPEEQRTLDTALYESRMRFVSTTSASLG